MIELIIRAAGVVCVLAILSPLIAAALLSGNIPGAAIMALVTVGACSLTLNV
jgi:hypothetical protein